MSLRTNTLKLFNKLFPIDVNGDAEIDNVGQCEVSCVINFYRRTHLLRNILSSLSDQDMVKDKYEVVLVEDRNGSPEGRKMADEFSNSLNIRYITLEKNFGIMGYSRNIGVLNSKGNYILFLDDDTVIIQKNFLSLLVKIFREKTPDGIVPRGMASFCIVDGRYQYHDPFFPTNRCVAFTKDVLAELKGFKSKVVGQEDVEFALRLAVKNKSLINQNNLEYYHPPLIQNNFNKSAAVGYSYYKLKNDYPFPIWLLLLINGCRYLPFVFLSVFKKYRYQFNFSMGFLIGIYYGIIGKETEYK